MLPHHYSSTQLLTMFLSFPPTPIPHLCAIFGHRIALLRFLNQATGWAGSFALGSSYISLPWLCGQVRCVCCTVLYCHAAIHIIRKERSSVDSQEYSSTASEETDDH